MLKAVVLLLMSSLICSFSLTNSASSNFSEKQGNCCQYSQNSHSYTEYVKYSKTRHKFVCDCGAYVLQNHIAGSAYKTIGSTKYTNCIKCGETISMNDTNVQLN